MCVEAAVDRELDPIRVETGSEFVHRRHPGAHARQQG